MSATINMQAIKNSIASDRQTYRWFLMLICLPDIRQQLSAMDNGQAQYKSIKRIRIAEVGMYALLAALWAAVFVSRQPWGFLLGMIPLAMLAYLSKKSRQRVAAISEEFLLKNADLGQQTLFELCEGLSKKFNIPSLVDTITHQDFIVRKSLLYTIVFISIISSHDAWTMWNVLFAIYFLVLAAFNTSIILQKLK